MESFETLRISVWILGLPAITLNMMWLSHYQCCCCYICLHNRHLIHGLFTMNVYKPGACQSSLLITTWLWQRTLSQSSFPSHQSAGPRHSDRVGLIIIRIVVCYGFRWWISPFVIGRIIFQRNNMEKVELAGFTSLGFALWCTYLPIVCLGVWLPDCDVGGRKLSVNNSERREFSDG